MMNQHRTVTTDHPIHRLPELVASVRRELGLEGETPLDPPPDGHRAALRFLRRPRDVQSSVYRDLVSRTDYSGADDHVRHFCERLYREAAKQRIPMRLDVLTNDLSTLQMLFVTGRIPEWVAASSFGSVVVMTHATDEGELPWSVWPAMRQIAKVAANGVGVLLHEDAETLVYPWLLIVEPGNTADMQSDARRRFRVEERKWMEEFRTHRSDPSERGRKGE